MGNDEVFRKKQRKDIKKRMKEKLEGEKEDDR